MFLCLFVFLSDSSLLVSRTRLQVVVCTDSPRHQPLQPRRAEGPRGSGSAAGLPRHAPSPGPRWGEGREPWRHTLRRGVAGKRSRWAAVVSRTLTFAFALKSRPNTEMFYTVLGLLLYPVGGCHFLLAKGLIMTGYQYVKEQKTPAFSNECTFFADHQ